MAAANSVDEYISNLNRRYLETVISISVAFLLIFLFFSYQYVKEGYPREIYFAAVAFPIGYLIWGLFRRRKKLGERIWNILCPSCNEYIPLYQFDCPDPCDREYTDRSIIEGCPKCNARYKKAGHDAFRYACCDNCNHTLNFDDSYDFRAWSVLSKGETWETETIVVKNDTPFSSLGIWIFVMGLPLFVMEKLDPTKMSSGMYMGIYVSLLGLLFMIIHKVLYGDTKRIPNPTFKRNEEPKELYVSNASYTWASVLFLSVLILFASSLAVYIMIYQMFILPHNSQPGAGNLTTFTPYDISWRVGGFAIAIILIVAHSIFYKEYVRVPNPRYKEEES